MGMERAEQQFEIISRQTYHLEAGTTLLTKIGIRFSFVYKRKQIFAETELRNTETKICPTWKDTEYRAKAFFIHDYNIFERKKWVFAIVIAPKMIFCCSKL